MTDLTTAPDRAISDALFYADARCAELMEMDALNGGDEPDPAVVADFEYRSALRAEVERRERDGISIEDPDAPTLEERLAPYGIEWETEQRERAEGR